MTPVGLHVAAQQLEQGGFASAVHAGQDHQFTGADGQGDIGQEPALAKMETDVMGFQNGRGCVMSGVMKDKK